MNTRIVQYTIQLSVSSSWTNDELKDYSPIFKAFDVFENSIEAPWGISLYDYRFDGEVVDDLEQGRGARL